MKKFTFKRDKSQRLSPDTILSVPHQYQFNDRVSNACFIIALVIILATFWIVWRNIQTLPIEIPLFFQRPWGEDQLAPRAMIWMQPISLILFFVINYGIALFTAPKELLTARILGGSILICAIMGLISTWNIINLMTTARI